MTGDEVTAPVDPTNAYSLFSVAPPSDEWKKAFTTCLPDFRIAPGASSITLFVFAFSASNPR